MRERGSLNSIYNNDLADKVKAEHRWTFDKMDFGDSQWLKDNLILNIAIGYPF